MYFWSGGESRVRRAGMPVGKFELKLYWNRRWTRDDEHPCTFHMGVPPRGIYVALCGTNQIEATKLRVQSTNEKAGQNPLTEAEGQTRLSLLRGLTFLGKNVMLAHI